MGIRRVAGSIWNQLLMRVDDSTGKGTSVMVKFSSKVHGVHMELGGKLLNSLRIETQFLERLQSVCVVDGATHTQKDDVESNRGSLESVAEVFVLFLCGVQLVLRSGVLTILGLNEMNFMPSFTEVFRSVLCGVGGSASGWRYCWGVKTSPPQLSPATSKNPPSCTASLLLFSFCGDGSNQYSIRTAGGKPIFVWEPGWKEPLWYNPSFSCIGILKILASCCILASRLLASTCIHADKASLPVFLMALNITVHAMLLVSFSDYIRFLICMVFP